MVAKLSRRIALLAAGFGVVLLIAACSDTSPTQPDAGLRTVTPNAHFDDDTTNCLNGWIIISGKTECA